MAPSTKPRASKPGSILAISSSPAATGEPGSATPLQRSGASSTVAAAGPFAGPGQPDDVVAARGPRRRPERRRRLAAGERVERRLLLPGLLAEHRAQPPDHEDRKREKDERRDVKRVSASSIRSAPVRRFASGPGESKPNAAVPKRRRPAHMGSPGREHPGERPGERPGAPTLSHRASRDSGRAETSRLGGQCRLPGVFAATSLSFRSFPWPTPRCRTAARRPSPRPTRCRPSTRLRNTRRTSRSRTRTRRARSRPSSRDRPDQHPGQRQRQAACRDRFRGRPQARR